MNAGIKYCGGCNPGYDRAGLAKRLAGALGEKYRFEAAREGTDYDVLIIVCGCSSRCADYSRFKHKNAVIIITKEDDYTAAYENLKNQ